MKLTQVFLNLLGNAVKFTPGGGQVTIGAVLAEAELRVRISDTGIGIRAEDIPLVLQPFYRVNSAYDATYQGAGLGLPFAKAVVELHGGTLAIDSRIGEGTTVTIALPVELDLLVAA
jgi:two-component system cell cycle sensor histidine kinase PleC